MLLLARIDDRLRSELVQHPAHPAELRRRHSEGNLVSAQLGFQAEVAIVILAIIQDEIAHNPGVEVRYRSTFCEAVFALLHADHGGAPLLVAHSLARARGYSGNTLLCAATPVWVVVRPQQNESKFHTRWR